MWWILGFIGALLLAALVAPPPPGRRVAARDHDTDNDDLYASVLDDPVERLLRTGYLGDVAARSEGQEEHHQQGEDRS